LFTILQQLQLIMDAMNKSRLQGLAQLLVQYNLLNKDQVMLYQEIASNDNIRLLQYLVNQNLICPNVVASSIAEHFGVPIFDLDCMDIASIPENLVHEKLVRRYHIMPLFVKNNQLYVATDDPSESDGLKEIQFHTGFHVSPLVVETHKLTRLINQLLHKKEHQGLVEYVSESNFDKGDSTDPSCEDEPVVKFIKRIILEAVKQGVSDIHFEPYDKDYRIRYRQDGLLTTVASPPPSLSVRIAVRIKVLANLDISERRIPQDGRFKMLITPEQSIDIRVSTCPMTSGEKFVLRILDTQLIKPDLNILGFTLQQKTQFLSAVMRPQGLILVTGPTGSGKTMTLYSALNLLNTGDKNVSAVEDPVEINVHGINQVNINPKAGLTFASILRAFLRQDPDVIMIGEIRDLETAEIAIKASQTGHLVLSTLHTNSAAETLTRLVNMGLAPFNIASSISLIVAQRLIRCLCIACKIIRTDLSSYGFTQSYKAVGCPQCTEGYRGRMALFEVMPISKIIAHMIMSGSHSFDLLKQAQAEGMLSIHQAGLDKIKQGLTSIEELNRVMVD